MDRIRHLASCKIKIQGRLSCLIYKNLDQTDKAVEAQKQIYFIIIFDEDPQDPFLFVCSDVYKNDVALLAHLVDPALVAYFEAHAGV